MLEEKAKKSEIWMKRIIECRNSGLSDRQWCRNNEIIPSSFYYWVKRLRIDACTNPSVSKTEPLPQKQAVVPLHIIDENIKPLLPDDATAVVIHFNSIVLEIKNGAGEATITNTMQALRQLC